MMKLATQMKKQHQLDYFISTMGRGMWRHIYRGVFHNPDYDANKDMAIAGPVMYHYSGYSGNAVMSRDRVWLDPEKFMAIYRWYHEADPTALWIMDYFDEYKNCVYPTHMVYRSNYGVYVYKEKGLQYCFEELVRNPESRRACIVINDKAIMQSDAEIDKLCTNAINYYIDGVYLKCVVQMRSSNMATLLPYDAFMFAVFHAELWQMLRKVYAWICPGDIVMQVANAHLTMKDLPVHDEFKVVIRDNEDLTKIATEVNRMYADPCYVPLFK